MEVYAAGISVKVVVSYPGRSVQPGKCYGHRELKGKGWQKSGEGIAGSYRTEGSNLLLIAVSIF